MRKCRQAADLCGRCMTTTFYTDSQSVSIAQAEGQGVEMNILVIDGQGGGVGRQLVEGIKKALPGQTVIAAGTNALATQAMLKAGADHGATGENAVIVGCRRADIIAGPIGIVIADSLWGEITPRMAVAVGQSQAARILLPMNLCDNYIAGVERITASALMEDCISRIREMAGGGASAGI